MSLETSLVHLIVVIWLSLPFEPTVLDKLNEAGIDTYAVGKINDIFNGAGINHDMGHNKSNSHGIDNLIKAMTSKTSNMVSHSQTYGRSWPALWTSSRYMDIVIAFG